MELPAPFMTDSIGEASYDVALSLTKGNTYTLPVYRKTSGVTSGNGMSALIVARYQNASGWKYAYEKNVSGTNDWDRVEVTFTIPSDREGHRKSRGFLCRCRLGESSLGPSDLKRGRKFGIVVGFKPVSGGAHSWYEMYYSEDSADWQ